MHPFNKVITSLAEAGINRKLLRDGLGVGGDDDDEGLAGHDWTGLGLEVLQGAFLLHLALLGVSVAALTVEVASSGMKKIAQRLKLACTLKLLAVR